MINAFKRFFAWLSGQAPGGQRKLVFCTRLELMLLSLFFFRPDGDLAVEIVKSMVVVGITAVGGNGIEHIAGIFHRKAKVTDGTA
jgi:hypothetical protein